MAPKKVRTEFERSLDRDIAAWAKAIANHMAIAERMTKAKKKMKKEKKNG